MSLYWYLQYFAALGLFALIRLWVLIFNQFLINFDTKNQQKSNKKTIQNRSDFLIQFSTVFFRILAQFGPSFGSHFGSKIDQNGGAGSGTKGLSRQLRTRSAQGYPQTLKMVAQEAPGPEN